MLSGSMKRCSKNAEQKELQHEGCVIKVQH